MFVFLLCTSFSLIVAYFYFCQGRPLPDVVQIGHLSSLWPREAVPHTRAYITKQTYEVFRLRINMWFNLILFPGVLRVPPLFFLYEHLALIKCMKVNVTQQHHNLQFM